MAGRVRPRGFQFALLGAGILLVAFLAPGIYYWHSIGAHYAHCVYGDPTCSLTVSTYGLAMLTGAAFIAAFRAAHFAAETIEHEKAAFLALTRCDKGEGHVVDMAQFSLPAADKDFAPGPPAQDSLKAEFDCHNVGRSPIVDGRLDILITPRGRKEKAYPIELGNIMPGEWTHVRLHVAVALGFATYAFGAAKHRNEDLEVYTGNARLIEVGAEDALEPIAPTEVQAPAPPAMAT